jgi:hypothetical protein
LLKTIEPSILRERLVTHYLDLLDKEGKPPRLKDVSKSLQVMHPEYGEEQIAAVEQAEDFGKYLATRRKEHLNQTLGARLLAAEWGLGLSNKAAEELFKEERIKQMKDSDLIALLRVGTELAQKVDVQVREVGENDGRPATQLNQLFLSLSEDRAKEVADAYFRYSRKEQIEAHSGE